MEKQNQFNQLETICAPATSGAVSAIGVIRLSGEKAIEILRGAFRTRRGKKEEFKPSLRPRVRIGYIIGDYKEIIDEVVCTIYHAPRSYTGEDVVEISHHGSTYVQQQILKRLISLGARMAKEGEFSQRAFLNGKLNLSQTEAVADLIQSRTAIAHNLAIKQLKGGYQQILAALRKNLLDLLSLLELELDFSEEDVEFAQRGTLKTLMNDIYITLESLINSFDMGNAFKNGIPIAIIGKPNAGKSTLFNALIKDERAIVSPISGTTRDTIEENLILNGIEYRFIDTAGVRKSEDPIEAEGIRRSFLSVEKANIIIYVCDVREMLPEDVQLDLIQIDEQVSLKDKKIIIVANKCDGENLLPREEREWRSMGAVKAIAKEQEGISEIIDRITAIVETSIMGSNILMTNARHHEAMQKSANALKTAQENLKTGMPIDIISSDIRETLHYLGEITGEVTTEEVLGNIFSKFCIGK
jgi:tRNA modification GTPase